MSETCDILDSTPPWLQGKPQSMEEVTLHDEIQLFCKWISPTREEQMMRESVIVRISCVVCQLWPTAQVKTYGSYATQLYLPNSDVDLCVTGAPPGPQSLVTLAEVLHAKELSTQLHVISSAKVPIIKLTDKVSGSIVDISLNQDVRTNELVNSYMEKYSALRPLTLILKLFLFQRRLHESYTGGLSSFSLLIIIVSYLQFHVPDSTCKSGMKIANKSNLGNLLIDFFKFYGKQFDYEHIGISIRDNGSYFPKMSRNWYDPFNPCVFSLESPLDQASDVGRGGFATPRVIGAFAKAHDELTSGGPARLSSVLIVDSTIIERRNHIMSLYTRQSSSPPITHHHRTQRSVSATAAMQTVSLPRSCSSPFKPSFSIPIPTSSSSPSVPISSHSIPISSHSIPIATPTASASSHPTTQHTPENRNPLFLSSSAPPQPLSPPSPPSSHTPIHISPATSPRMMPPSTSAPPDPTPVTTHPTISGFDAKTATDSSTDSDTDTDGDADVDTDGDHSQESSSSSSNEPALTPITATTTLPAPSPAHQKSAFCMSGLDYYLRTMQNHFQSLHPTLTAASHHAKLTKSQKRLQKLQQLQQQLAQHASIVELDGGMGGNPHTQNLHTLTNNVHNAVKGNKKDKNNKDKHRNNYCMSSTPPTSSTPPPHRHTPPPCISSDSLPPTAPHPLTHPLPTTPTKGRRNSNPQGRRNSNPQARRNSNPPNRRNSNPPPLSTTTTPATCLPIPEKMTSSSASASTHASSASMGNASSSAHTSTTPTSTPRSTTPTPTLPHSLPPTFPPTSTPTANATQNASEFSYKTKSSFPPRPNPKQQRWAPKVSNSSKKLNLLQSCSVPVSN